MGFDFFNQECASLKTSKDTFRWDSPQSSAIWKSWVTKRRGEYSQRVNAARLTSASVCSSRPTISVNESKNSVGGSQMNRNSIPLGTMAAMHGQAAPANPSTHGSRQESWATPTARDHKSGRGNEEREYKELTPMVERQQSGKLNPRWVETLMGLPVGWTMPSCLHPIADPANAVTMSSAGDVKNTTQTAHVLGQIAVTTDNRTDELRLLGNGVVPATAEKAFRTLMQTLHE
jgi:hypothetical protein